MLATAGVLLANAGYFLIAAVGLATALAVSAELFTIVKWCGAAYLIWIGIRLALTSFSRADASPLPAHALKALGQGFLTQAANPNLIVYFAAILPQFIDPDVAAGPQFLILGISSIVIEALVLCLYARTGGAINRYGMPTVQQWINRMSGAMLVAAGILLGLGKTQNDT